MVCLIESLDRNLSVCYGELCRCISLSSLELYVQLRVQKIVHAVSRLAEVVLKQQKPFLGELFCVIYTYFALWPH